MRTVSCTGGSSSVLIALAHGSSYFVYSQKVKREGIVRSMAQMLLRIVFRAMGSSTSAKSDPALIHYLTKPGSCSDAAGARSSNFFTVAASTRLMR